MTASRSYRKLGPAGWDARTAWSAMNRTASGTAAHAGRAFLPDWEALGYCASESNAWAASCTLAYAYDDWAAAEMATEMGEPPELIAMYRARALNYRHVWDNRTKLFCPRSKTGSFKVSAVAVRRALASRGTAHPARCGTQCPLDPAFLLDGGEKTGGYVEGDAEQWKWFVPHDVMGLAELFGGKRAMARALDDFMTKSAQFKGTALPNPFYWAGNEPDILAPWLGSLIGRPDLTARFTRWVLDEYYARAQPDSLPGNDDFGTLSAWAVWGWLGWYPLAGTDTYILGSPRFPRAILRPFGAVNKTVELVAHGAGQHAIYVRCVGVAHPALRACGRACI